MTYRRKPAAAVSRKNLVVAFFTDEKSPIRSWEIGLYFCFFSFSSFFLVKKILVIMTRDKPCSLLQNWQQCSIFLAITSSCSTIINLPDADRYGGNINFLNICRRFSYTQHGFQLSCEVYGYELFLVSLSWLLLQRQSHSSSLAPLRHKVLL